MVKHAMWNAFGYHLRPGVQNESTGFCESRKATGRLLRTADSKKGKHVNFLPYAAEKWPVS